MVIPDLVRVVWFRSVRVTDGAETWGWGGEWDVGWGLKMVGGRVEFGGSVVLSSLNEGRGFVRS